MDGLYATTTEDSLSALAEAGFIIDVSLRAYDGTLKTRVKISKGSTGYGGGFDIMADEEGADGVAALRGAVATAETFLATVPKRARPKLPDFAPLAPPMIVPEADDVDRTEARRAAALATGLPQAGDRVREREDTAALSPF